MDQDSIRDFFERNKRTLNGLKLLGVVLVIALLFAGAVWLAGLLLPITIGLLLSTIVEPLIRALKKIGVKRKWATIVGAVLLYGVIVAAIALVLIAAVSEVRNLVDNWQTISQVISGGLESFTQTVEGWTADLSPKLTELLENAQDSILTWVSGLAASLARWVVSGAFSLPSIIIFLTMMVLSSVMMMRDREKIGGFLKRQLPQSVVKQAQQLKNSIFGAVFGYLRAQLVLMCITFCEIYLAFTLFGVEYAILLALIIAVVDALPVFGAGLFLIPATGYFLVVGNMTSVLQFGGLYVVLICVRQMIEPRLVGNELGMHPLLTLAAMYGGMQLWGWLGLIFGPVAAIIFISILKGYFAGRTLDEVLDGAPPREVKVSYERPRLFQFVRRTKDRAKEREGAGGIKQGPRAPAKEQEKTEGPGGAADETEILEEKQANERQQ